MPTPKGVQKRLAGEVFRLQRSGSNVPRDVRRSARLILQNKGTDSDVSKIQGYLGISRSGAGTISRAGRKAQQIQGAAFDFTQNIELLRAASERGENTAVATSRIVQNINDGIQAGIRTKWAKRTAERAATIIGKDPVVAGRFLKALGRGLRLGGIVATAGFLAVQAVEKFFNTRQERGQAIGERRDLVRQLRLDPRLAALDERRLQREIDENDGLAADILNELGLSSSQEKRLTELVKKRVKVRIDARQAAGNITNVSDVLSREAARRGKLISELTEDERAEAIDRSLRARFDPESFRDDPRVFRELEREFGSNTFLNLQHAASIGTFGLIQSGDQRIKERIEELATEFAQKAVDFEAQRVRDSAEQALQMRRRRSPVENQKHREALLFADRNWNTSISRYKAWSN